MSTRPLAPRADNEGGVGTSLKKWATGFIKLLTVDSINKVAITAPASGSTLTIADGKTLTVTGDATISGTPIAATDAIPSPGAYGETTPNTLRGINKEIFVTSSSSSPLTAPQCSRTIVSNYGMTDADCLIDLPAAAAGLLFMCILPAVRSRYFRLKGSTGSGDIIYLNGVAGSSEGYVGVASGYSAPASCSFFTFKATDGGYDWYAAPIFGTWVSG